MAPEVLQIQEEELWAVIELMGHAQTAGRVEKPSEWGGLMRVDVPAEDGSFTTELLSMSAIYRVKFVSEEIARAYAPKERDFVSYDTPIVTREQHETEVRKLNRETYELREQVHELERWLTQVKALPEPSEDDNEVMF